MIRPIPSPLWTVEHRSQPLELGPWIPSRPIPTPKVPTPEPMNLVYSDHSQELVYESPLYAVSSNQLIFK